jgi:hypothetical protein
MTEDRPNLLERGHQKYPPVARPADAAEFYIRTLVCFYGIDVPIGAHKVGYLNNGLVIEGSLLLDVQLAAEWSREANEHSQKERCNDSGLLPKGPVLQE